MACDNFLWFPTAASGGLVVASQKASQPQGETMDEWMSKNNALEIKKFTFGVTMASSGGSQSGGHSTGKVAFNEFQVEKLVDLASVPIYQACTVGAHYPYVLLAVRKAGGMHFLYLQYIFAEVFCIGIDWSGGGGDELFGETIKFRYGAMSIQYCRQKADGQPDKPIQAAWSVVNNSPSLTVPDLAAPPAFLPLTQQ